MYIKPKRAKPTFYLRGGDHPNKVSKMKKTFSKNKIDLKYNYKLLI